MRARRFIFFLSVVVVALAGLLPFAVPAANGFDYVRNGSFEDGATGWVARHQTSLSSTNDVPLGPVDGATAGRVVLSGPEFEIRPATNGVLGSGSYAFTAQVLTMSPGMSVSVDVRAGDVAEWTSTALGVGAWTPVSVEFYAPTASSVVVFISGTGRAGDVLYIDAVRLEGGAPVTYTPTATMTPVALAGASTPISDGTVIATATVAVAETVVPDVVTSYVRNGSFEEASGDGMPVAWQKFGGDLAAVSAPVRTGSGAARLVSDTSSTKWLYQTVLVSPSQTYAFDAWVAQSDANVAASFLRVSWYASDDGSGEALGSADSPQRLESASGAYRHLTTGPITAPADARSARLRVMLSPDSAATATIFVDDVSFEFAEPPRAAEDVAGEAVSDARVAAARANRPGRGSTGAGQGGGDVTLLGGYQGPEGLVINEVLYDPDIEGSDAAGEWVEIYNASDDAVSLAGWALRDNARAVVLPDVVVPSRAFVVVAASDRFLIEYPEFEGLVVWLAGRIGNGLGNEGDALELLTPAGTVVDAVSWGDDESILEPSIEVVPSGHSIERVDAGRDTDAAADFADNHSPSPGVALEAATTKSKPRIVPSVEILEAAGGGTFSWAPWALVALSSASLAGVVGWRAVEAMAKRGRAA